MQNSRGQGREGGEAGGREEDAGADIAMERERNQERGGEEITR